MECSGWRGGGKPWDTQGSEWIDVGGVDVTGGWSSGHCRTCTVTDVGGVR